MDNDNLLVQKAADLYRGLRFKMKYRGVPILSAGAGNDLARDLLESGQPFLFGRLRRDRDAHRRRLPAQRRPPVCRPHPRRHPQPFGRFPYG